MLHRNYVFALLLSFTLVNLNGQSIQVVMSPNPSPYISDWQDKTETATLIISNISGRDISVKIKTELYDSKGTLVANTDASKMPILIVPPGVNQYHAEDIFPSNAVSYKGSLQISTVKTGRIPDDSYKFCVTLTDPQNGNPMGTSGTVCKMFNILDIQAPVLINPRDEESIPESGIKGIVFRWSPVAPAPKMIVTYRLQIWEVLEGQNGMTALRSNQPIVEKDYRGLLQTQWPVEFAMPEVGKKYVWTVTPLDDQERKLVDGNGFAQPFGFSITSKNEAQVSSGKTNDSCLCKTWKSNNILITTISNGNSKTDTIACNSTFQLTSPLQSVSLSLNFPSYICAPSNCTPSYSWVIDGPQGPSNGVGNSFSYVVSSGGFFSVNLFSYCGGTKCDSCNFIISSVSCECKSWNQVIFSQTISKRNNLDPTSSQLKQPLITHDTLSCGDTLVSLPGEILTSLVKQACTGNCLPSYSWKILNSMGVTVSMGNTASITLPNLYGTYTLVLSVSCGGNTCQPCTITLEICDCEKWAKVIFSRDLVRERIKNTDSLGLKLSSFSNVIRDSLNCNDTFYVRPGINFSFSTAYACRGTCSPTYSWQIKNSLNAIMASGTSSSGNFTLPAVEANYSILMQLRCGKRRCPPCKVFIHAKNPLPSCSSCSLENNLVPNGDFETPPFNTGFISQIPLGSGASGSYTIGPVCNTGFCGNGTGAEEDHTLNSCNGHAIFHNASYGTSPYYSPSANYFGKILWQNSTPISVSPGKKYTLCFWISEPCSSGPVTSSPLPYPVEFEVLINGIIVIPSFIPYNLVGLNQFAKAQYAFVAATSSVVITIRYKSIPTPELAQELIILDDISLRECK